MCVCVCLQGRISQLEEDMKEERCGADRLEERLDKTKAQAGSSAAAAAAETKHIVSGLKAYICFYHEADFEGGREGRPRFPCSR